MKKFLQAILLATVLLAGGAWAAKVDINKADEAALIENLEGIGPVKAKAIVNYRKKNGSFKTYDDLMQVPGIGVETVKKNKANLSLSGGITKASGKASSAAAKKPSSSKSSKDDKKSANTSKDKVTKTAKEKAKDKKD